MTVAILVLGSYNKDNTELNNTVFNNLQPDGFVIDNDISIQDPNSQYGFSNLIFMSGEYNFINQTGVYVENGIQYSYLGYVDITVEAN